MVFASRPVDSESRLAARPVGAHNWHRTLLARRMSRMALTSVVLPTPGPPVIMRARLDSACFKALCWLGANSLPVFCWHHAKAFSKSIAGKLEAAEDNA